MQSHHVSHINLDKAKELALSAIRFYQGGRHGAGDRYGHFHGRLGALRARKLSQALTNPNVTGDKACVVALFLAIFGEPNEGWFGWSMNRSSSLASFIADAWIAGGLDTNSMLNREDSLSSTVISSLLLNESKLPMHGNWRMVSNHSPLLSWSYFDKTKAIRFILGKITHEEFSLDEQKFIRRQAKQFRKNLEDAREEEFSFSPSFFEERHKERAEKATLAACQNILPKEICMTVATFFSPNDVNKFKLLNKSFRDSDGIQYKNPHKARI